MVEQQIRDRGVRQADVLRAMESVPRHLFVPADSREQAYGDAPLPIGWGQTISQPYIVALMTSLLELTGQEKVLEVGTGSGYQTAVLGALVRDVREQSRPERGLGRIAPRSPWSSQTDSGAAGGVSAAVSAGASAGVSGTGRSFGTNTRSR